MTPLGYSLQIPALAALFPDPILLTMGAKAEAQGKFWLGNRDLMALVIDRTLHNRKTDIYTVDIMPYKSGHHSMSFSRTAQVSNVSPQVHITVTERPHELNGMAELLFATRMYQSRSRSWHVQSIPPAITTLKKEYDQRTHNKYLLPMNTTFAQFLYSAAPVFTTLNSWYSLSRVPVGHLQGGEQVWQVLDTVLHDLLRFTKQPEVHQVVMQAIVDNIPCDTLARLARLHAAMHAKVIEQIYKDYGA